MAVYHEFQLQGQAAGPDWRERIESAGLLERPAEREALAEILTARLPRRQGPARDRYDGTKSIRLADLALAYAHAAITHHERARASSDDRTLSAAHLASAAQAIARLDAMRLESQPVPPTRLVAARAAVLAEQGTRRARSSCSETRPACSCRPCRRRMTRCCRSNCRGPA
ncbi:MAG: hypothetical protein WKF75_05050 [Singulisphaera sp.]